MAYQDQLEKERADAKNAVEEYVYNTRDKVEYSLSEFIAVEEKGKFLELLNATEEWLYDEGEDQPKKVDGTEMMLSLHHSQIDPLRTNMM